MQYMLLAYAGKQQPSDTFEEECRTSDELLRASGHLVAAHGLQPGCALTVQVQEGRLLVALGASSATGEQLVGVFLIDARDLNQAIQLAATMPQAQTGPIEVRPVQEQDKVPNQVISSQLSVISSNRPN